ncbi:hypothetical protein [Aeromonas sp. MR16]|uniref:hypothetical protein n=1 Tax=Aeromonas sp. MR16 TaxID=2923420 RepID=UPI001F4AAB8E|nr:hypothetical protein [Aeromonas sp. MR16]MCH7370330.1 hypothetical protein [Aeromonas sp. MR16]
MGRLSIGNASEQGNEIGAVTLLSAVSRSCHLESSKGKPVAVMVNERLAVLCGRHLI